MGVHCHNLADSKGDYRTVVSHSALWVQRKDFVKVDNRSWGFVEYHRDFDHCLVVPGFDSMP